MGKKISSFRIVIRELSEVLFFIFHSMVWSEMFVATELFCPKKMGKSCSKSRAAESSKNRENLWQLQLCLTTPSKLSDFIYWFLNSSHLLLSGIACKHSRKVPKIYCWWLRNPKQPPGMYKTPADLAQGATASGLAWRLKENLTNVSLKPTGQILHRRPTSCQQFLGKSGSLKSFVSPHVKKRCEKNGQRVIY